METFYNEHLKKALEAITKEKTNKTLGQMAAAVYATSLLIPAIWDKEPKTGDQGQLVFPPNTHFQFALLKNEKKNSFLVMFTNYEEFRKWDPEERFQPLVLPFRQFMNLIEAVLKDLTGVLIDPLTDQVTIGMDFLRGIKVGQGVKLEQKQFEEGDALIVQDPKNADSFLKFVKENTKAVEEVKAVYVKEREGHWFIVVDSEKEDTVIFQKLGRLYTPHALGRQMEFIFASVPACEWILKMSRPVYKK